MCDIKPTTGEGSSAMKRRIPGGHAASASETCLDWPVTHQLRRMSEIVEGGGTADDGGEEKWPRRVTEGREKRGRLGGGNSRERGGGGRKWQKNGRGWHGSALGGRQGWQGGGREVAADGSGGIVGGGAAVLLAWQVQVTLQSECVTHRLEGRTVEGQWREGTVDDGAEERNERAEKGRVTEGREKRGRLGGGNSRERGGGGGKWQKKWQRVASISWVADGGGREVARRWPLMGGWSGMVRLRVADSSEGEWQRVASEWPGIRCMPPFPPLGAPSSSPIPTPPCNARGA
ncbi:hypothetical protein BXZ70DRAFT_909616 [Cristinia sonorae]|uniref:Uncharacterized protein n=1 Tax=Cristinia sonorae TaxID=1940300 RepID=A0A8K0UHN9_9AGAR|nr:hypothetical protein BXZ70DRAFT_909616 [Cristinia sonorae]